MGRKTMDSFDYIDQTPPARKLSSMIWNVLTLLVLLTVLCVIGVFLAVFVNPNSSINPFPPAVIPTGIALPSMTPTPRIVLPATWTASPTLLPTQTFTPAPTNTPLPSETPFSLFTPTATFTGEPTVPSQGLPFVAMTGTPLGTSSLPFHPEVGCDWIGVAGQVFDLSDAPVSGQIILLGGTLDGKVISMPSLTGMTNAYGTAGFYEFTLGEKPLASTQKLWVQMQDQAGLPMSERVYFDTYDSCDKNLIFVNFKQVR
jgi:hypothetical protein